FDRATALEMQLRIQLLRAVPVDPQPPPFGTPQAKVEWHYSTWPDPQNPPTAPTDWPPVPGFAPAPTDPLTPVAGLQADGVLRLPVPANAGGAGQPPPKGAPAVTPRTPADEVQDNLVWLGVRILNQTATAFDLGIDFLLFNSVSAHNALTIPTPEMLGKS